MKNDSLEKGGKGKWEQEEELRRQLLITRHAPGYTRHVKSYQKCEYGLLKSMLLKNMPVIKRLITSAEFSPSGPKILPYGPEILFVF